MPYAPAIHPQILSGGLAKCLAIVWQHDFTRLRGDGSFMGLLPVAPTRGILFYPSLLALVSLCASHTLSGQTAMQAAGVGGTVRIFNTDEAVLESQEVRKDLACQVEPVKPSLGFDLRFHSGYEVTVPLHELSGSENTLTMIFRVTPDLDKGHPRYFSQHVTVPKIEDDAKGDAFLQGTFDLGEGAYHVDWLMRDRSERLCSSYWNTTAALNPKDREVALSIAANIVEPSEREPFKEEPPVTRDDKSAPLNIKVMVNFAPQRSLSPTLQPIDTNALVSILRNISREPRICKFSIVAFNMQEQRVLYRQDESDQINFPALGDSLNSLNLGTVNLKKLEQKHGDTGFLSKLIAEEMTNSHPDAMIFAGPKVMLEEGVPIESLKQMENIEYPIFYMNYNLYPQANPWRDAIGNAVKHLRGMEYTISRPRDLWVAWSDIVTRIVRSKSTKGITSLSSH